MANPQIENNLKTLETGLNSIVEKFKEELSGMRSSRPSVQLVENIKVDVYGQQMTIKQLAAISIRPPRDIEINTWDKSTVQAIAKGIDNAKVGLSVSNEGNTIRASLSALSEERRQELMKLAKKTAENFRIHIRNVRDETNKKIKALENEKSANEDDVFKAKEKIQKSVNETNEKIEKFLEDKIKELGE